MNPDKHLLRPLLERVLAPDPDPAALDEFFRRLRPYLHGVARKVLGTGAQGPLDHSDLVQSSLRRIFQNLDKVRTQSPSAPCVLAWVERILRNRIVDELRRVNRQPTATPADEALPEPVPPEEGRERDTRMLELWRALAQLPERHRQVVELHWFDRLPDVEIAHRLGGTAGAVKVLRCRALRELAKLMEAPHDDQ
jgi:RNA polymerase sigma-70 factor (ECF subfamily)